MLVNPWSMVLGLYSVFSNWNPMAVRVNLFMDFVGVYSNFSNLICFWLLNFVNEKFLEFQCTCSTLLFIGRISIFFIIRIKYKGRKEMWKTADKHLVQVNALWIFFSHKSTNIKCFHLDILNRCGSLWWIARGNIHCSHTTTLTE